MTDPIPPTAAELAEWERLCKLVVDARGVPLGNSPVYRLIIRVRQLEAELARVAPYLAARGVKGYRFGGEAKGE